MNALEEHINEIKRFKGAIAKSNSTYLKNDYSKHLMFLMKELKIYCKYRGYNYKEILKIYDI